MIKISAQRQKENNQLRTLLEENRSLGAHQVEYESYTFEVYDQVFSPRVWQGWKYYTGYLSGLDLRGKHFLEIGCGSGITGLYLAGNNNLGHLVLTDINPRAIENARTNAVNLALIDKVDFIESDVFDRVPSDMKFDVIYWNCPWELESSKYRYCDELERGLFDAGYESLEKFLQGVGDFLRPNGQAFLGFGNSGGGYLFRKLCNTYGVHPFEMVRSSGFILYEIRGVGSLFRRVVVTTLPIYRLRSMVWRELRGWLR